MSDSLSAVIQLFVNSQRAVHSLLPVNNYFTYEKGFDNRTCLTDYTLYT